MEKQRKRMEERKRRSRQAHDAKLVVIVLHGIHQKGVGHSMSGGRTLLMWSSFKRGHLSDRDPCRAMPKRICCRRGKKIQLFVLTSRWERKSHLSLEFVGVSVFFWFFFVVFFSVFKLEMDADVREPGPGRETESTKKLVCE